MKFHQSLMKSDEFSWTLIACNLGKFQELSLNIRKFQNISWISLNFYEIFRKSVFTDDRQSVFHPLISDAVVLRRCKHDRIFKLGERTRNSANVLTGQQMIPNFHHYGRFQRMEMCVILMYHLASRRPAARLDTARDASHWRWTATPPYWRLKGVRGLDVQICHVRQLSKDLPPAGHFDSWVISFDSWRLAKIGDSAHQAPYIWTRNAAERCDLPAHYM